MKLRKSWRKYDSEYTRLTETCAYFCRNNKGSQIQRSQGADSRRCTAGKKDDDEMQKSDTSKQIKQGK